MQVPATPISEAARLRALQDLDILDTAAEADFDALTRLAAQIAGVPIALVTFVDAHRQWFKSRYGLEAVETPREVSFCAHVVAEGQTLVVTDATEDPRFSDNPYVVGEPRVRFYLGLPLTTAEGHVVGTLCAIDHVRRVLSLGQRESLALLARQVANLLELRRTTRRLTEQQSALLGYQRFHGLSGELLMTVDLAGDTRDLNPAWTALLGWSPEALRDQPYLFLVHPDDAPATDAELQRLLRQGGALRGFENRYRHRSGHYLTLSWSAIGVGGVLYAAGRDVTALRAQESSFTQRDRALEDSQRQLRVLFEGMAEGMIMQDRSGAIVETNGAAERILGLDREALLGRTSTDHRWGAFRADHSPLPGDEHPAMVTLRTGEPLTDVTMGIRKPSGEITWLCVNSRALLDEKDPVPRAVITTFRDVTQQRMTADRSTLMARQERLVTTGTLAAGVGHEINNPLSYVVMNLEQALEELRVLTGGSPSGRYRDLLETLAEARQGAERVRRIVRGLRSLAREDGPPLPTEIAPVVEVAVNMAMHELRQTASVLTDVADVPPVLADEPRLTQVLVNLLVNAAQAFVTSDPARNQVRVRGVHDGERVVLTVADNGPGIAAEVLPRIFDPFFTTKPVGVGTGLGLSISHGIAVALGGQLSCTSTVGVGTTFTMILPAATARAVPDAVMRESAPPVRTSRHRILVVDDEESVTRAVVRVLARDYEVVGCTDPREALTQLEAGARFDVIFSDLMMPHLTGIELLQRLRALDPQQADRLVFMSGGIVREDLDRALAEAPNERIDKPFTAQHVRALVKSYVRDP